jgi:hypothetical protein
MWEPQNPNKTSLHLKNPFILGLEKKDHFLTLEFRIRIFTSSIEACSPYKTWPPFIMPSSTCFINFASTFLIQIESNLSFVTIYKLYKTIQVETISGTDFKGIFALFEIILHLPFRIPNACSTNICVEN